MVVAAFSIAVVANAFAGRERRLVLPGYYPNATKVPERAPEKAPPPMTQTQTETAVPPAPALSQTLVPLVNATTATTTSAATTTTTPAMTTAQTTTTAPAKPEPPKPEPMKPKAPDISRFQPHPSEAYIEISGADADALHKGGALFLDARRTSVYEAGHIPGARSFSVWEADIDDKVNALFGERSDPVAQNQPIVIYCSGGACEDSHMLAQKLWGIQFNNVYVYKDGFPDWQDHGRKVNTGAQP